MPSSGLKAFTKFLNAQPARILPTTKISIKYSTFVQQFVMPFSQEFSFELE